MNRRNKLNFWKLFNDQFKAGERILFETDHKNNNNMILIDRLCLTRMTNKRVLVSYRDGQKRTNRPSAANAPIEDKEPTAKLNHDLQIALSTLIMVEHVSTIADRSRDIRIRGEVFNFLH